MSFLYPAFLVGALAIAIPIVLHLLRRDVAPEVPFTAVRFLRRTPLEQTRRRRIRDLVLLAARVAALLLLAFAFARPYFAGAAEGPLHIVAIDRSYSMGAPGRVERARALAREAIDSTAGARVAVIAFDERADVVAEPGSAGGARAALDGISAGPGATSYDSAVERAIELAQGGPARLTIVSDLQRAGWEREEALGVPESLDVQVRDAGAPARNVAIVDLQRADGGLAVRLRAEGAGASSGEARVLLHGRVAGRAAFTVAAGETVYVRIPVSLPEDGAVAVEIDDEEGFPADNRRYAVLDARARARVLVVAGDAGTGFYMSKALEAAGEDEGIGVRTVTGAGLARLAPGEVSGSRAIVLLSTRGLDRRAREALAGFVRGGGGLVVTAGPDVDPSVLSSVFGWSGFSAAEATDAVSLAVTDLRHPIVRPFAPLAANLGQVRFTRTWQVRADGWDAAARFTNGFPALLERNDGGGRVVLFASDVDRRWNEFPLHPAFAPFAFEAVRHVAARTEEAREVLVRDVPPGVPAEPGVHAVPGSSRPIVVNVDPREGTTARVTPDEFGAMLVPAAAPPATPAVRRAQLVESRQNLWRYGLLLMLGALIAESFVGRAR